MTRQNVFKPTLWIVGTALLIATSTGIAAAAITDPALLNLDPADAIPVPGDYDGDGFTDMSLKGSNGVWYIDFGANGLGGLWDFASLGYDDATGVPVPARYDADATTDLSVKDDEGMWGIDYAATGFGLWDWQLFGYGNSLAVPVPADYDNDGLADLSVKTEAGIWLINYSADGLGSGWNVQFFGYGNSAAIPVPGDYDGDQHADLSVKDASGCWYIDYWSTGYGAWDEIHCGYGDATAVPVPADYDNDGRTDVSVKGNDGNWYVDYSVDGFGAWNAIYSGRGDNSSIAVTGDYDHDGSLDLSAYSTVNGYWYIDYAANGFLFWDTWVDNGARTIVDTSRPYITSTTIYGEGGVVAPQLTVGVRYTVDVVVHRGTGSDNKFGVEINESLNVPESLKLVNRFGSTFAPDVTNGGDNIDTHRRFALTPTQPGNFPLGFQLRNDPIYYFGSHVFNADTGIRVNVVSPPQTAISGRVNKRIQNAAGVFVRGDSLPGARIEVVSSGGIHKFADEEGEWRFPIAGGSVPMHIRITMPGFSEVNIVNLMVPPSGLFVQTDMEQEFTSLPSGIEYKTYLDYRDGRRLLHVVEVSPYVGAVQVAKAPFDPAGPCPQECIDEDYEQCPAFEILHDIGDTPEALVVMNGTWWNLCTGNPIGYVYGASGFMNSDVWCDNRHGSTEDCSNSNIYYIEGEGTEGLYPAGTTPMFTVSPYNRFDIVESEANFLDESSTQWSQIPYPIWDVSPRDSVSDVAYAIQIPNPPLLRDGDVIASGHFVLDSYGNYDNAFPRTTVGVGPDGTLYLVAADGEGVHGGNGPTGNQMGHFYKDVLGASRAMGLDSGLSTELLIKTPSGLYRVNTLTGEDAAIQLNPYTEVLQPQFGGVGCIGYYMTVSNFDPTPAPTMDTSAGFALRVRSSIGSMFTFDLTLPQAATADLKLYDVRGRQVASAFRGDLDSGAHMLTWAGTDDSGAAVGAGIYFYRFTAGDRQAVGRVVLMR